MLDNSFQVIDIVKNLENKLMIFHLPYQFYNDVFKWTREATMTDIGVTGGGTNMIYIDGKKNNVVKNVDLEVYLEKIIRQKSKNMNITN